MGRDRRFALLLARPQEANPQGAEGGRIMTDLEYVRAYWEEIETRACQVGTPLDKKEYVRLGADVLHLLGALQTAVKDEREACAKIADAVRNSLYPTVSGGNGHTAA